MVRLPVRSRYVALNQSQAYNDPGPRTSCARYAVWPTSDSSQPIQGYAAGITQELRRWWHFRCSDSEPFAVNRTRPPISTTSSGRFHTPASGLHG